MKNLFFAFCMILMTASFNTVFAQMPVDDLPGDPGLTPAYIADAYTCYPNPATDKVNVVLPRGTGKVLVKITNINGLNIFNQVVDLTKEKQLFFIQVGRQKRGRYILSIVKEDYSAFSKIILLN